jgi:hypothetical protein
MTGVYAICQLSLDPLTWDSVVAVGLFGVAVLAALARWWYRHTEPGRTFEMVFEAHPFFHVPAQGENRARKKSGEVHAGARSALVLPIHVTAKKPVSVPSCSCRLVGRQLRPGLFRLWRWTPPHPGIAFVTNIWDAEHEALNKQRPFGTYYRPSPIATLNNEGGYTVTYSAPLKLLAKDSLWFRVVVIVSKNWDGYLEFSGPAMDGRRASTQRGVKLRRSTVQEEDPQTR